MPKVRTNNINTYYEVTGEGEPLVFVHGLGSSTRDWEGQVPAFSKSYQVITYDMRGHGLSDKPEGPYQIPMFASDLAGLLHALGLDAIHLVGISLGGCVAFQFAISYPELVKTLVIVNSTPGFGDGLEKVLQDVEGRAIIVKQKGMRGMGQVLSEALFPKPDQAELRETMVERWAANDPRAYIEAMRTVFGWNVMDELGLIKSPTLVISSDQDTMPLEVKERTVRRIPDARLVVIPDAHHFVTLERPKKFNAALGKFLSVYN
ncbi:MAG: alpha/beta fold hydrolase [Candidatus Thorarchaeota archaeon]